MTDEQEAEDLKDWKDLQYNIDRALEYLRNVSRIANKKRMRKGEKPKDWAYRTQGWKASKGGLD